MKVQLTETRGHVAIVASLLLLAVTRVGTASASSLVWDHLDSHQWTGESWGSPISVETVTVDDRRVLQGIVAEATNSWALIRTKRFPLEDWRSPRVALRVEAYIVGANPETRLKLEIRGATFDPVINPPLLSEPLIDNAWQTVAWTLPTDVDLSAVGAVSIVIDGIDGKTPTLYLDNMRFTLSDGSEKVWDALDGGRNWFYFGNWFNWTGQPLGFPGIEPISSSDGSPDSPAASLYLQWDRANGQDQANPNSAEIGTDGSGCGLNADFSQVDRVAAWVRSSSTEVAIRVFFFHRRSVADPCTWTPGSGDVGFATASAFVRESNVWQFIIWDIPWPADFDRSDVDELKLVVDNLQSAPIGEARFDELSLFTNPPTPEISGRATVLINYDDQNLLHNQLGGAFGVVNDSPDANRASLLLGTTAGRNGSAAALRFAWFDFPEPDTFAGAWNSLLGRADYKEFVLDLRQWDYLRLYIRGSGKTQARYQIKIEVKDSRTESLDAYRHTAYRYISIDDADTGWKPVVLSLRLDDNQEWSFNQFAPDPSKAKELVFVVEGFFNPPGGEILLDDIELINTSQTPEPVTPASSDTEFLEHVLNVNLKYFQIAVHPDTGLVLDRLPFSDLVTVAGTGFGLTAWSIAAESGAIARDEAYEFARKALTTLASKPMGSVSDPQNAPTVEGQIGVEGYFYHFLDSRTGLRHVDRDSNGVILDATELSSVDTALCAWGIISCRQAMTMRNGYSAEQEATISELANAILRRINWPFLLWNDPNRRQVNLAWKPEHRTGFDLLHPSQVGYVASRNDNGTFIPLTWDFTTDEILLIALAGMASPDPAKRFDVSVMQSWLRPIGTFAGQSYAPSYPGSAFTYQFADLWLPLKSLPSDVGGTSWWSNSRAAMMANLAFCRAPQAQAVFSTFDGVAFGITACEDPSRRYNGFGSPAALACPAPSDDEAIACILADDPVYPNHVNGTLGIYGAGAAIDFLPQEAIAALRHYYFDLGLWNHYVGFPDAYHNNIAQFLMAEGDVPPEKRQSLTGFNGRWSNTAQFSIDQGPLVIALANYLHSNLAQNWSMHDPDLARAISVAFPGSDTDGDGILDLIDNCPQTSNPDQADADRDGVGDACDGCKDDPAKTSPGACDCGHPETAGCVIDSDMDGVPDSSDNCAYRFNPDQADADHNGIGDACDDAGTRACAGSLCGAGSTITTSLTLAMLIDVRIRRRRRFKM